MYVYLRLCVCGGGGGGICVCESVHQGVQRRASTELKSQLFSAMGALDGIAGVDTRNYRLSCSIVLDGDGVDMTSPAADAAKQYGHHDLSESLIVHVSARSGR